MKHSNSLFTYTYITKASGPDNLPSWVLNEFAMELSSPVAEIFNASYPFHGKKKM